MVEHGHELFNRSRERFKKDVSIHVSKERWKQQISNSKCECWLGFDRETGRPASFAINKLFPDYCDYSSMGISPDFPNNTYPMYGLIYEMNRYYLEDRKVPFVCDGARSITEHSNIQPFLEEKFKFRKAYCDFQLFYKPWLGVAVKTLFPFRRWINNSKIVAILRQEAWARGMEK